MGIFRQFPYSNFHEMNMDEILKIVKTMNEEWDETKTEWNSYKEFIDNYFENLDVSAEVLEALRIMANNGELNTIIDPVIINETTEWLNEHITPTTPVIDSSLTISGAGADAKVTGDKFNNIRNDLSLIQNSYLPLNELIENAYVDIDGSIVSGYNNWSRSDYIPVSMYSNIIAKIGSNASRYNCFYDINKNFISSFRVELSETNIAVPGNAYFVIFSGQTHAMEDLIVKAIPKTDAGVVKLNKSMSNTDSTTINGVTYSVTNDTIKIEGTTTAPFNFNTEGSVSTIPGWLTANTIYYVNIKKHGRGTVYFEIDLYDSDSQFIRSACKLTESGSFNVGSLSGVKGAIVKWYIPTGSTVNVEMHGDIFSKPSTEYVTGEMENSGIIKINNPSVNIESVTTNNVTYSRTNDLVVINGTASSAVDIRLEGSVNSFPDWIKENTDYLVKIQKTGTGRIVFEVDLYDVNGLFVESACAIESSGRFRINSLSSNIFGVIVRYYVPTGSNLNNVSIKTEVFIDNNSSNSDSSETEGSSIRVMQYNIGKFRWGYSDINQGLTETQYLEKLPNYKKLFGKYQPDIVGLQEYVSTMDKAQTHNAYDNLFNALFNTMSANSTDTHQTRILGCCNGDLWRFQNFTGDGRTVSWTVGEIYIDDKTIAVATGALSPYDNSGDYYDARMGQITEVLNALSIYDYAIIMFDSNIKTTAELAEFKQLATSEGYLMSNGDYWGTIDTYVAHPGMTYPFLAIDTIWTKGNIKIRNFEVLTEEYDGLSSDHIPVIADLFIY